MFDMEMLRAFLVVWGLVLVGVSIGAGVSMLVDRRSR